ncbi:MAG: nuclear transcription factor Y subunit A-7 [Amphiamblys sp. WSBS2006]|nr:MAG: nuclear transcription factor Y subunit A-7 [Amphiamblys sp. WSBS2006]
MPNIEDMMSVLEGAMDRNREKQKAQNGTYDKPSGERGKIPVFNEYTTERDGGAVSGVPIYVNAKQYHRILRRRDQRMRLASAMVPKDKKRPYLHKSRHDHAMRRPRGPGGRFLTKEELGEWRRKNILPQDGF